MAWVGEKIRNSYSILILFPENCTYNSLQTVRAALYPRLESNDHFKNDGNKLRSKWL